MNKSKITGVMPIVGLGKVKLYELTYLNRLGNTKKWTMASRRNTQAIVDSLMGDGEFIPDAVVINARLNGKLVLIHEYRPNMNCKMYSLPAGIIEDGEDAIEAAKRELYEETGLSIQKIVSVSPPIFSSAGLTDENVIIVDCIAEGNMNNDNQTDSEDIDVMLVGKDEVEELLTGVKGKLCTRAYFAMKDYLKDND